MFRVLNGEGNPYADSAQHHILGIGSHWHGAYRGTIPGITGGLAICHHVRGQRFSLPAPVRDPGQGAFAIIGVVKRFVTDMGVPRSFRTDNGAEYTPQQNGPVESGARGTT